VEDLSLKEKVNVAGKDLTTQLFCDILNTSYDKVYEMNLTVARRHLYAYHVQMAYKLRKEQLRAQIANRKK